VAEEVVLADLLVEDLAEAVIRWWTAEALEVARVEVGNRLCKQYQKKLQIAAFFVITLCHYLRKH
jgi:hypothetical protein